MQKCANTQPSQPGAYPGQQAVRCLSRHTGPMAAFLQRNWRVVILRALSQRKLCMVHCFCSIPYSMGMHCHVEMRACPSLKLGQMFCSNIFAALSVSKAGAVHPSICPLFSRLSKRRRGVSFCQVLQLPGMFASPHHLNPNTAGAAAPPAPVRGG